ncbi:MAG: hypothetical protein U5J64_11130 [Halobacteriales archaeon]|nr:hypothetical protein [Halobacteriales archaeon]
MAKAIRTTENSTGETEGYTVVNEEDGIGEVLYHVKPRDGNEAGVVRYSPSAGGVSDADEEDKLPQRVPPSVANEIINLGFDQITVGETVMAIEDPAEPAVGDEWYRVDLGVLRRQTPQGVVETRDFYRPGEDYKYTDYGIAPVTVLEEGFEDTDPVSDSDWSITNETGDPDSSVVSPSTAQASEGDRSLEFSADGVAASYTAMELDPADGVYVEFEVTDPDGTKRPVVTFVGGLDPIVVDLAAKTVGDGIASTDLTLDFSQVNGAGWYTVSVGLTDTEVTVEVEGDESTISDDVSPPTTSPVQEIGIGTGAVGGGGGGGGL